jgi:hypothetical protein
MSAQARGPGRETAIACGTFVIGNGDELAAGYTLHL